MEKLTKDSGVIYEFNKENTPTKVVEAGSTLEIETYDCFLDQIQSEDTVIDSIDWDKVNPATGPVYIEGAEPGDVLKVKVDKIEIDDQGVMVVVPELGMMGKSIEKMQAKILEIKEDHVIFDEIKAPLNKMIGVIGVAPEQGGVNCGTPGAHGGNMDTKLVEEGATLYFPVAAKGALFALGDLHAAMGDGEVSGSGVEVAGKVTVTFDVIKGETITQPMLENEEGFTQIASAENLDEAQDLAGKLMVERIVEKSGKSLNEVTMLMSMVGQAGVGQIVNPLKTARFTVPKQVLDSLEINLIED
jgi:amidase